MSEQYCSPRFKYQDHRNLKISRVAFDQFGRIRTCNELQKKTKRIIIGWPQTQCWKDTVVMDWNLSAARQHQHCRSDAEKSSHQDVAKCHMSRRRSRRWADICATREASSRMLLLSAPSAVDNHSAGALRRRTQFEWSIISPQDCVTLCILYSNWLDR